MNVEIGAEAEQFPEKEYINGIAFAVCLILAQGASSLECISTDQPDKDQCSKHQRSADQRLSTSTKIG
jgi:hypothetical protein